MDNQFKRWYFLLALSLLAFTAQATDNSPTPLRVGLLPFLSTDKLLNDFAPIKHYLESKLHRPVMLVTAPSFQSYVSRATDYEYDLYLTAPHIAAMVEQDYHYRRVSRLARELDGSIVVRKDGKIKKIADLKGGIFIAPSNTAIVSMLGEKLLQDNQLFSGKNVTVTYTPSHNNAILAVANGQADAAVTSAAVFEAMPQEVRDKLTILTKTSTVPHMMFMASPKLSDKEYKALRNAMLEFTADGAGQDFFKNTGYGDMTTITNKQMQQLKPYVRMLKDRLESIPP